MGYRLAQPNFAKGEIAPDLYGRFDVDAYSTSLRLARNVHVLKYGGLTKRPGTRFVAEVLDDTRPVRLVPFQFSIEQAYALEMGHGYMRVAAAGGLVLNSELAVTSITNEAQAKVTAAYHGYSVGNVVYLSGIAGALGEEVNFRFFPVVAVIDANNFRIGLDSTDLPAYSGNFGGITRTSAPPADPADPVVPPPVDPSNPPITGGSGGEGPSNNS